MKHFYPLFEFYLEKQCEFIKITEGLRIVKNNIKIDDLSSFDSSKADKLYITKTALYCLEIDENYHNPKEASLGFMISSRLLKRSTHFIKYVYHEDEKSVSRIKDAYPTILSNGTELVFKKSEFETIKILFNNWNKFKKLNVRTGNACYFITNSYILTVWLDRLLYSIFSLETLCSADKKEKGESNKIIGRIRFFLGLRNSSGLKKLYNIRSELVHGRYRINEYEENLEDYQLRLCYLAEEIARKAFFKILTNEEIITAFEDDNKRMLLFKNPRNPNIE